MSQPTPPAASAAPTSAANATAEVDVQTAETAADSRRWKKKLKIGGVIAAVVLAECVVVYMVMPRSAQTSAAAESEHDAEETEHKTADHGKADASTHGKSQGGHGKKGEEGPPAPPKSGGTSEESDLGEFSVTSYQPASNTTLFISFHLFGTLLHKNSDDFSRRIEDNKHRIRDNIIIIIRSAEITDLTDPGLGLIKRRILETTNKTLGKPLLQAVVFSDFSLVEQ